MLILIYQTGIYAQYTDN